MTKIPVNVVKPKTDENPLPDKLNYYVCLFKIDGHRTFRVAIHPTVEGIERQLRTQLGKHKVTQKKFFEIDRINGTFEEF